MTLVKLGELIPDYAMDLKKNLQLLAEETILTPQQKAGAFLVAAMASRNAKVTEALFAEYAKVLSPSALSAVGTIASIMPVYNLYYRFAGLSKVEEYEDMPLKLRLSSLAKTQIPDLDKELWIVTVSAVNACALCIQSHEPAAREAGAKAEQIQAVVRIAAVIYAIAAIADTGNLPQLHAVMDSVG